MLKSYYSIVNNFKSIKNLLIHSLTINFLCILYNYILYILKTLINKLTLSTNTTNYIYINLEFRSSYEICV
ncbi:MAG: hypothetical protein Ta2F_17030 [Termitinemataceae bacterium]|nr:MAG: hypothetical protein Ta2F_17030 [Termitinemataceae bacterium]